MSANITIAKDSNDITKHISEVENGLNCNCYCLGCGKPLIAANNGKIQDYHFKHQSKTKCDGSPETALHLLAKRIISDANEIFIDSGIGDKGYFRYDNVEIEKSINGIRPDIQVMDSDGNIWLIELAVTHFIDDQKLSIIRTMGLNCLEIDLKNVDRNIKIEHLKKIVLDKPDSRKVLYPEENPKNNYSKSGYSYLEWIIGIGFVYLIIYQIRNIFFKKR